jgi:hypothetical protein
MHPENRIRINGFDSLRGLPECASLRPGYAPRVMKAPRSPDYASRSREWRAPLA